MSSRSRFQIEDKVSDQDIDLSCEGIMDVPVREIAQYPRAINLDISNNHIRTLTVDFATSLRHLVQLDLSKNLLQKLPENFGLLVNLRHLDLYSNQLERLPLSMSKLRKLRFLDLKDNPLVPSLKKIVGECWNAEQCHACSKNVVAFMAQIEQQVGLSDEQSQEPQQLPNKRPSNVSNRGSSNITNGLANRPKILQTAKLPQDFSSDEELESEMLASGQDDESVSHKKKRKRYSNKKELAAVKDEISYTKETSNSSGFIVENLIWLGRAGIWLTLFCLVFILLCSVCLSNAGLKSVISSVSSADVLTDRLVSNHDWIQKEFLRADRFIAVRDMGKEFFVLFVNYFSTLVESVANSVGALTSGAIGK